MVQGGTVAYSTRALLDWAKEDGLDTAELDAIDWEELGYGAVTPELMDQFSGPIGEFFESHTRAELVQGSLDRRILLFPVATPAALDDHPQLIARVTGPDLRRWSFQVAVDLEGLGHIRQLGLEIIVEAANLYAGRYRRLQLYVFLEPASGAGGGRVHSYLLLALSEAVLHQEHDLEAFKDHVQFTLHGECGVSCICLLYTSPSPRDRG